MSHVPHWGGPILRIRKAGMAETLQHPILNTVSSIVATATVRRARRLRVLHVVPRLGLGGTEHGILKVVNGLGDGEFEHGLCGVRGIDASFVRRMNLQARTYSAGTADPGMQFPFFRLLRIIREFRPNIVHTRNFGALEAILAARMARVPVVIHSEHGYELEILRGLPFRRRVLYRALFPMADAVFTVTKDLRAYY